MAEEHLLVDVARIDAEIEAHLERAGHIFRAFRDRDSGSVAFGVEVAGERWFVKHSEEPRGIASLERARELHEALRHPALPTLRNAFRSPRGLALVYEWVAGEVLSARGEAARRDPRSAHARFRALSAQAILAALDVIYDAHALLARRGFVAVDFYDGSVIYDFERGRTHLCDLDEYRRGPFALDAERLPGSTRFMAPEEFQSGARIDQVTNVFTLGRTALVLLGDGSASRAWKGSDAQLRVALRATAPDRGARHPSVPAFVDDWKRALGPGSRPGDPT